MTPPQLRGRVPNPYLTTVLLRSLVHFVIRFLGSYNLMSLISFADVVRIPTIREVEARVVETLRKRDALIRRLVGLSAKEADILFVHQEILDAMDRIEATIYNSEFRSTVMCLLDALSELCEAKNIKVLKGPKYDVHLHLQEEEIRVANLTSQQTRVLKEIGPLVQDVDKLIAKMEVLKECFSKVMNHLESRKRFIDHVSNSICWTIYIVDHCRGELMS